VYIASSDGDAAREPLRLTPLPCGEFFGFALDGNRRFVLGAFQVTHNTLEDDEPVVVQLLSGASTQFTSFSVVSTNVVWDAAAGQGGRQSVSQRLGAARSDDAHGDVPLQGERRHAQAAGDDQVQCCRRRSTTTR
jgi:hypothetical protein